MAITWRNIGQSTNAGNSLITGGADTITEGLGAIRNAAKDVSNEQIRQYDTQAELNTANILNQIQRSDKDGLGNYSIDSLSSSLGSQFDPTAVTTALGDRANQLREFARQDTQDQLKQDEFGLKEKETNATLANLSLENKAINRELEAAQKTAEKNESLLEFDSQLFSSLGNASTEQDIRRQATLLANDNKLSSNEAAPIIDRVVDQWNKTVGNTVWDKRYKESAEALLPLVEQGTERAMSRLNSDAMSLGLKPDLLELSDDTSVDIEETKKYYNDLGKNSIADKHKTVEPIIQEFKRVMGDREPTGAEVRHFANLAFESGTFANDGFKVNSRLKAALEDYRDSTSNSKAVQWYKDVKGAINKAKEEYSSKSVKEIQNLQRKEIENNQTRYKGESVPEGQLLKPESFNPSNNFDEKLRNYDWITAGLSKYGLELPDPVEEEKSKEEQAQRLKRVLNNANSSPTTGNTTFGGLRGF